MSANPVKGIKIPLDKLRTLLTSSNYYTVNTGTTNCVIINNKEKTQQVKCRVCLEENSMLLHRKGNDQCFKEIKVKDAILKLVPKLRCPIQDCDVICDTCFQVLENTFKLIETVRENDALFNNVEDSEDSDEDCVEIVKENEDYEMLPIQFVSEGDVNSEERYFEDVSVYCNSKCVYKFPNNISLELNKIANHNKIITFKNCHGKTLVDFLHEIGKKIDVFQHDSVEQTNAYRVLLFGENYTKICVCQETFTNRSNYHKHLDSEGCDKPGKLRIKPYFKAPSITSLNCDLCNKQLSTMHGKKAHMIKCAMYECNHCKQKLAIKDMIHHSRTMHNDSRPYVCNVCSKKFKNLMSFNQHLCVVQKCKKCGKRYKTDKILSHHCEKITNDSRPCPHCNVHVPLNEYTNHVNEVHRKFICKCKYAFLTSKDLERHENFTCYFSKHLCPHCGKMFTKGALGSHLKLHSERSRTAECSICHKKYFTQIALRKHQKSTHNSEPVTCEFCGITVKHYYIKSHIKLKHAKKVEDYKCEREGCGRTFSRKDYLDRHLKRHEGKGNTKLIPYRKFYRKLPLSEPLSCKFCLKQYTDIDRLRAHLITHAKLVRYQCRYCPMSYTSYTNRLRHERSIHKTSNNFRCDTCWKCFSTKEKLDVHTATKHQLKKYKCEYCDEKFSRYFQLNAHLIAMHVEKEEIVSQKNYVVTAGLEGYIKKIEKSVDNSYEEIKENCFGNEQVEIVEDDEVSKDEFTDSVIEFDSNVIYEVEEMEDESDELY